MIRGALAAALTPLRDGGAALDADAFEPYLDFLVEGGLEVVERLRQGASNLAGLKVSASPFEKVRPYLVEGFDVFVGAEALLAEGLAAGAAGAVSGLAAAFPSEVAAVVRSPSLEGAGRL